MQDLRATAEISRSVPQRVVDFFFETLAEFSVKDKVDFCKFAYGRAHMPIGCKGVRLHIQLLTGGSAVSNPDGALPNAHTCGFGIDLPRYTSKDACKAKLLYAVRECKDISEA